jgi:hypothetical protein
MLLLRLHSHQFTATLLLAGAMAFSPLAIVCTGRVSCRAFWGVWLFIAGCGWLVLCFTAYMAPQYQDKEFTIFQPAFFGEIALTLWLVIKGAKPPALDAAASSAAVG